jgi:hypothetical protein
MLFGLFRSAPDRMFGRPRSSKWRGIRAFHLKYNQACVVCGEARYVEVHHILPVHVAPESELDPDNLVTLCDDRAASHHFQIGHGGNWMYWNMIVRDDAKYLAEMYQRVRGHVT